MARTAAGLSAGTRVTDYVSLGVVAKTFPRKMVDEVLAETGKASRRQRDLPAHVVVYYVIALALYMSVSSREVLRCLLEGVQWLMGPTVKVNVAGKSGISQARTRLGSEPVKQLHDRIVGPIAGSETRGAWFGRWRLVSLDGSTLAVADTHANEQAFGRPGESRGKAAYPLIRLVSLVENGTHVLFGTLMGAYHVAEATLAADVVKRLEKGMLCLADRSFFGYDLWWKAQAEGCDLLWRVKRNLVLPCMKRLGDGSYISKVYPSPKARRHDENGLPVRVVEYELEGIADAEPIYRLITTILEPRHASAEQLAVLYHERWEIETAFDELKTHLKGPQIVLRSKTPDLVKQELYGLMMAHYAVRGLMHEAALKADEDPDNLSFTHAVRVVRRHLPMMVAVPPTPEGPDA